MIDPSSRIGLIYDYNTAIPRARVLFALPAFFLHPCRQGNEGEEGYSPVRYDYSFMLQQLRWSLSNTASPVNKRTIFWQINFTKLLALSYRREKIFNILQWRDYVIAVLKICKGTVNPRLCMETLWFKHTKRLGSACFLGMRSGTILVLFFGLLFGSMSHCCDLFFILTRYNK